MFTATELFDLAIRVEVNGERFYRYAMRMVKGDSLKKLFGWLADQELLHGSAFREIRRKDRSLGPDLLPPLPHSPGRLCAVQWAAMPSPWMNFK